MVTHASTIHASFRFFYTVLRRGRWPWLYLKRLTLWIIGVLDASWISTGPNWSPMTRSVLVLGSHSCQTLFVDAISLSIVTSTVATLGRIITAPSKLASWVLLWSGDRGPADQDRPGWEWWRPTYDQWTLTWRQPNDVHRTERHGDNSWQWVCPRQAPEEERHRWTDGWMTYNSNTALCTAC